MSEKLAQYSCDTCRTRKVGCSRNLAGCQRCVADGIGCLYSRSGVIRRDRTKRKSNHRSLKGVASPTHGPSRASDSPAAARLDNYRDGSTSDRLQGLIPGRSTEFVKAIAALLEEYHAAWQGSAAFDDLSQGAVSTFFVFGRSQTRLWLDEFAHVLKTEKLLLTSVPPDVTDDLASSRPDQVQDRSWLVMFYSIALNAELSKDDTPANESTKSKLRKNLWLAFNDVRLLLEPAPSSIQALVIFIYYAEHFMTPSVCWSLINKACTMLQALGFTQWRLNSAPSDLRTNLFWRLRMVDSQLALILCRVPTFCREMEDKLPMPSLDKLVHSNQGHPSDGASALFEAHYISQMHHLSRIMNDMWHILYGRYTEKKEQIKESLGLWHQQATEVLEAAALVAKPLLNPSDAAAISFGLKMVRFHYLSLLVLFTVSSRQMRSQSTDSSQELLNLLPSLGDMMLNNTGPYACLLWHCLHCPATAFGLLWGEIVTKTSPNLEQSRQSLQALEHLPLFLARLKTRNPLAVRLQSVMARMMEHARLTLDSQEAASRLAPAANTRAQDMGLEQQAHSSTALSLPDSSKTDADFLSSQTFSDQLADVTAFFSEPYLDAAFDWFAWDNQDLEPRNDGSGAQGSATGRDDL